MTYKLIGGQKAKGQVIGEGMKRLAKWARPDYVGPCRP